MFLVAIATAAGCCHLVQYFAVVTKYDILCSMSEPTTNDLSLPSAGHTAAEWRQLREDILAAATRQSQQEKTPGLTFDRTVFQQLLQPFPSVEFAVDWQAPLSQLLQELRFLTEEILPVYEQMAVLYPTGQLPERSEMVSAMPGPDWDPAD